ncbi:MAG: cyclic pyranopterin monophosphate synthase MoaC [Myxococcaceae bacterium]|nr:cyclic pyranopterin monophosphate synthase MoaC [Myxococcaceae bacterium]
MKMVDVGGKEKTERVAVARGRLRMSSAALAAIRERTVEKGDVLAAARLAAILGAKKTPDLGPLCHPIALSGVEVDLATGAEGVDIKVTVKTVDRTGVEMEALTAVSAAALTVYDMLKAIDRGMVIEAVQLEHKRGGRSGAWTRREAQGARPPSRRKP